MASRQPSQQRTRQSRTRHFKVWLKQSITSIKNPEPVFVPTFRDESAEDEARQRALDTAAPEADSMTTLTTDEMLVAPLCHNIDQAMNALHDGCCEKVEDARDFQAFTVPPEYDWILDGHVSFPQEEERSRQLVKELKGPNLEDLIRKEQENSEGDNVVAENKDAGEAESDEASDDEFGDFQTAESPRKTQQEETLTDTSKSANSQEAVGVCHLEDGKNNNDEEDGTLGDMDVPREIFNSPLHVADRSFEDDNTAERMLHDTMEDVSSPVGRFMRRLHQAELEEDSVDEDDETDLKLPDYYFSNPEWDSTLEVLRSMPWGHVPILYEDVDPTIVEEYILERLSQVDTSFALVKSLLLKRAFKQTRTLQKGNSVIHEMHHNLSMAEMYVERSQDSIEQARGSEEECTGVVGATVLLHEFDRRDQYACLQRLLDKMDSLLEKEKELNDCIQSFGTDTKINHRLVLERAKTLNQTAYEDDDLSRLECLDDLRLRANQVMDVFRNEIQSTLCSYIDKICHNWSICSDAEYKRLFEAMFAVHNVHLADGQLETSDEPSSQVVDTWSKCILETLCFQADKCFARALLDPTDSEDSEYDKELITLGHELKQDSRDAVKLISLTHNLVTIRFDFEANCNYLPMVYHRLCVLLTEVLHAHHVLTQHHEALLAANEDDGSVQLNQTEEAIRAVKVDVWRRCEQVLAKCLDQYHHFAAKKTLFIRDSNDDGTTWMEDLEGLHDVLRLTQQFLSLGHEFLDSEQMDSAQVTSLTDFNGKSELREKLCEAFRKHLRAIHVEAMTSLGGSLFFESWRLVPLKVDRAMVNCERDSAKDRRQQVHEHILNAVHACNVSGVETKARYWQNELSTRTNGGTAVLSAIKTSGNPFLLKASTPKIESDYINSALVSLDPTEKRKPSQQSSIPSDDEISTDIYSTLCKLLDHEHAAVPPIATDSVNNVLFKWASRLLTVMLKLPLVVDDATKIFRDLCDLYFITVFRLCAGNAESEKIALGIEPVAPIVSQDELEQGVRSPRPSIRKESSGFMGFGRRPSNSSVGHRRRGSGRGSGAPTVVSRNAEAEACAPLPSESDDVSMLRDFIVAGQINLENVVKLGKLEQRLKDPSPQGIIDAEFGVELVHVLKKRQATAWSCLLVGALLDVTRRHVEKTLTNSFLNEMLGVNGSQATAEDEESISLIDSITSYSETVVRVVPHMVNVCSRIACLHAIQGARVVNEIISAGPVWEESRLNEHSNDYVDELCDRYARIWHSLSMPPSAMPRGILEVTWEHICEGGFISLLEGFSRVPYCSTEGRSLMSMDLAAFADGIDAASIIHRLDSDKLASAPPLVVPKRGIRYVDMYIKVFYYPEEDVMKWIVSNYMDYQLNHMLALLTCGASDRDGVGTDIKKLAASVYALYKTDSPRSGEESGEGSAQRKE